MPFIAFELAALEEAPNVARAARITEDAAIAGMARMWKHCWKRKTDTVDAVGIEGFFGSDASKALVTFGFLEPHSGGFRVRGADRYLRLTAARKAGGESAKRHLVPGAAHRQPKTSPKSSSARAQGVHGLQPNELMGCSPTSSSALTPNTEHRSPNTREEEAAPAQSASPPPGPKRKPTGENKTPNPRHHPLRTALFDAYREATGSDYELQGRDFKALGRLAESNLTDAEIIRRWRVSLSSRGFDKPTDIHDFQTKINRYAGEATGPPRDITRGYAPAKAEWTQKDLDDFNALNGPTEVRDG